MEGGGLCVRPHPVADDLRGELDVRKRHVAVREAGEVQPEGSVGTGHVLGPEGETTTESAAVPNRRVRDRGSFPILQLGLNHVRVVKVGRALDQSAHYGGGLPVEELYVDRRRRRDARFIAVPAAGATVSLSNASQ